MNTVNLIFETEVKETGNNYTTTSNLPQPWVKRPVMRKVLFGVEIQKPTSYRIYDFGNVIKRTWVFGNIEINPDRFTVKTVAK